MMMAFCSQVPQKPSSIYLETASLDLDFHDCGEELNYSIIILQVASGYQLKKIVDEYGFCEYQLHYQDGTIFYVSSNIYSGSRTNYDNRLQKGIDTYSVNRRLNDTLVVGGRQENESLWKELIVGSYAVGYLNAKDPSVFERTIQQIKLKN